MKKSKKYEIRNILIGSVRAGHFTGPLDSAASSFYTLYDQLAQNWDGYTFKGDDNKIYTLKFGYFNAVPSDQKPKANLQDLQDADLFLLVAENEFQYANNKVNPMYRQYLDDRLKNIRKCLRGKTVIVLNSDIQHTPELIRNYTLGKIPLKDFDWVSENDFPGNVHAMKYWALKDLHKTKRKNKHININPGKKDIDFAYWGSYRDNDKSDIRAQILKGLRKDYPQIKSLYIGHLPPFTDIKWTRQLLSVVPDLQRAKFTICFGIDEDPKWLTARYHEAMGLEIIPLVWDNYDISNQLGILPWQRVNSMQDIAKKITELQDSTLWRRKYDQIHQQYLKNILSTDELYDMWEERLLHMII